MKTLSQFIETISEDDGTLSPKTESTSPLSIGAKPYRYGAKKMRTSNSGEPSYSMSKTFTGKSGLHEDETATPGFNEKGEKHGFWKQKEKHAGGGHTIHRVQYENGKEIGRTSQHHEPDYGDDERTHSMRESKKARR